MPYQRSKQGDVKQLLQSKLLQSKKHLILTSAQNMRSCSGYGPFASARSYSGCGYSISTACSFRWFIVAESTVRWFVVREKHCWMAADSADKLKRTSR
jgi:hypothetical protein